MAETEKYVPRNHVVRPERIICATGRDVMIKAYTMLPEEAEKMSFEEYSAIAHHVDKEIYGGRIDPRLGLGFMIASEGIVNLALWGGRFPSLLNQTVFSFDPKTVVQKPEFKREPLDEAGTFCCYEGAVVGHESLAWRRYLFSPQSTQDVRTYLGDQFRGLVGPHYSES